MADTTIASALTPVIVDAVLAILGTLITVVLASLNGFLKSKLSSTNYSLLQEVAADVVHAAEQGQLAGTVNDKKAYAMKVATDAMAKAGITVSDAQLSAAIEAAVLRSFNFDEAVAGGSDTTDVHTTDDVPADDVPGIIENPAGDEVPADITAPDDVVSAS